MAIPITIPRLGWSMEEGLFGEWVCQTGDTIAPGDPLFLLETEKALQEVESVDAGVLHIVEGGPEQGAIVRVGTVVAWLLAEGESPPVDIPASPEAPPAPSVPAAPVRPEVQTEYNVCEEPPSGDCTASPSVRRLARQLNVRLTDLGITGTVSENDVRRAAAGGTNGQPVVLTFSDGRRAKRNSHPALPPVSPRAARTARRLNVDWTQLSPSGSSGRISERDVLKAAGKTTMPGGKFEQASAVRIKTAERMAESARSTVPVTLNSVAQIDGLLEDRHQRRESSADGVPSIHDYVIKAVAMSLVEHPDLNACWMNGEILRPDGIHIGLAVDAGHGLLVPVIRNAERLSLEEIANESARLVVAARERRLRGDELAGGTFTISSLGALGIDDFTPVIAPGQGAILGVGAIRSVARPGLSEGEIAWRQQMTLSLTFDHQVTDGAPAARFLKDVVGHLGTYN